MHVLCTYDVTLYVILSPVVVTLIHVVWSPNHDDSSAYKQYNYVCTCVHRYHIQLIAMLILTVKTSDTHVHIAHHCAKKMYCITIIL